MSLDLFSRRGILELAIRAAALPGGIQFFAAWSRAGQGHLHSETSTAPPDPHLLRDYHPNFFAPEDFEALKSFTEILIPTDETPGASEAYCAHFIDFVLHAQAVYDDTSEITKSWRQAMAALRDAGFHSAGLKGRGDVVAAISLPERDPSATHPAYFAYRLIKKENTFAFYTARAGMIDDLDYKGNSYNAVFPACNHPEHQVV